MELQPVKIFEGLGCDAAHNGLTDFYPQHFNVLQSALNSAEPFDTGWYSVKKESQTARISCLKDAEKVLIEVSCEMDSLKDLIDSAIWEVCGKNDYALSGWDAMKARYPHATDRQIQIVMKKFESQAGWYDLGYDNCEKDTRTVEIGDPSEASEMIKDTIISLASACENSLENKYQSLILAVKNSMDEIVKEVLREK